MGSNRRKIILKEQQYRQQCEKERKEIIKLVDKLIKKFVYSNNNLDEYMAFSFQIQDELILRNRELNTLRSHLTERNMPTEIKKKYI